MNNSYTLDALGQEPTPLPNHVEVLVIGAGLSGLSAARSLFNDGFDVRVVDAADDVGGRVRTDSVEGFLLDRGFQVLLTAYEEVQAQVDVDELVLMPFSPGSLVWNGRALQRLTDPIRDPGGAFASATARVGTLRDKLKVAALRRDLQGATFEECMRGPERSTDEELKALGFSRGFIDSFFRPFLGGVFLERGLQTSAGLFRYYFRCFAEGDATLPARGMQQLPDLLASRLRDRISLGREAREIREHSVTLADGHSVKADAIIVAADGWSASQLLGGASPAFKATVTSYFATPQAPTSEPMLVLDGKGEGPANHVAVVSNIAPEYAPDGMHLVAVSGVDAFAEDPTLFAEQAPVQLRRWFGSSVDGWTHLKTYRIPRALPRHPAGSVKPGPTEPRADGLIVAGDYTEFGAIQGALASGRRAAEVAKSRLRPLVPS